MGTRSGVAGRLLYGALFTVVLPALLLLWADATQSAVPLPPVRQPIAGVAMAASGLALMLAGWITLWVRGHGLPMNAYPPPRLVTDGIYALLDHPIYVGFGAVVLGISIATGSSSGLWLVTPVTWLAMAALVIGYERPDLRRRFGNAAPRPRLSLPPGGADPPTRWERVAVLLLVFGPWLAAYYAMQRLGVPRDAFNIELPFERRLPVVQWTEAVYALTYLLVPLTPLLVRSRDGLRRFASAGLISTVVITLLWLSIPVVVSYRSFEPHGLLGRMLEHEMRTSSGVAAFPAFHVVWAFIAADAWSDIGRQRRERLAASAFAWTVAIAIAVSCVTTSMHAATDVVAAALLFPALRRPAATWSRIRSWTERIANSWKEWSLGPIRIMNYALYAFAAAAIGTAIAGAAAGAASLPYVLLLEVAAIAGAGLGAQALEGSPRLLRPFGYYGSVLGVMGGAGVMSLLGADVLLVLGAWAVASPWVQAIGRLRCLVQGCCHGGIAPPHIGIRYFHNRSRVTQLAGLTGVPLHATPLYSILANVVIGTLLLRLWTLGASPALVAGLYAMLNALARFAEESYRGEPQTRILAGLHIYHWFAIATFLIGMLLAGLQATPPPMPFAGFGLRLVGAAIAMGLVAAVAMGVDFPRSNRRFSRLAAAGGQAALDLSSDRMSLAKEASGRLPRASGRTADRRAAGREAGASGRGRGWVTGRR